VVELPKPPWYRRFGVVVVAANLVVAAVLVGAMVALWPRAAQRPHAPATTAGVGHQAEQVVPQGPEPATILTASTRVRLEAGVLWQKRGGVGSVGGRFDAPGRWRVVWSFNCQSFAKYVGATSSCLVAVTSRRSRCSALGSGDGASCRSPVAAEAASSSSRYVTGG
jgi:hypothetical protein